MTMPQIKRETLALLEKLAPQQGYTRSLLDTVRFMRSDRALPRTPVLYEPCIVIVCQGCKRGYLADNVYTYNASHYLVLSVPLPFSTETDATPQEPLLAVAVGLDMTVIADLVLTLDGGQAAHATPPEGILSTPLDEALADTTLRLLRALSHPQEAQILGPAIVKELYYRVLMGEQGGAIRAALASVGKFSRIARVLQRIHTDYAGRLDVATLAAEAGMSAPAFHAHFKAVTRNSPVQYIKAVRLHQARLMMIRDNLSAATAAVRVGYESPSQFNREFRRLFGRTPGAETREMKQSFALLPPTQFEAMTANH
ncbi:AraC family transcriptional regulator N-terminal domain-containing protein [Cronobacter dublinensis]|uniref:AraC family transcriptional regulator n=1 Tax=Cronobacter dublinensis TaxID=413497 RepID=UPI0013761CA9|nr:AraC family transcriptional regulator [Cronobacter dublinensis]EKY3088657.1 AraC family transcriptional regulator [Cronobacter dublinensis]ELQ5994939.1 AraC family transcriptional regulator [Cronobacter dublinensis]ELQ6215196.1 AraC family transcriptional regulator [Cronobacter dublinensis]ELQ6229786.1 AraC family transcriptional regulator [Cronobacter dublinensis]ELY4005613.1 AraC family transcriptional regulator [Cronobacter dublinensis]